MFRRLRLVTRLSEWGGLFFSFFFFSFPIPFCHFMTPCRVVDTEINVIVIVIVIKEKWW